MLQSNSVDRWLAELWLSLASMCFHRWGWQNLYRCKAFGGFCSCLVFDGDRRQVNWFGRGRCDLKQVVVAFSHVVPNQIVSKSVVVPCRGFGSLVRSLSRRPSCLEVIHKQLQVQFCQFACLLNISQEL